MNCQFYPKKIETIIIVIIIIIIIIIIVIFIMIVIIYLIRRFREIRCIQPKNRVSSLIPSLKFLFPLSLMEYNSGVRQCQL